MQEVVEGVVDGEALRGIVLLVIPVRPALEEASEFVQEHAHPGMEFGLLDEFGTADEDECSLDRLEFC